MSDPRHPDPPTRWSTPPPAGGRDLRLRDRQGDRVGARRSCTRRTRCGGTCRSPSGPRSVKRIGELFVERQAELAALATEEMGKPLARVQGGGGVLRRDLRLLRDRGPRARGGPADQDVLGWQGHGAEAPDRAAAGDHAVELPLLPDRPVRSAQPDAGQHDRAQARRVGAEVRARGGADHEGRRSAGGRLRQRVRHPRPDRADHRRPAHRRRLADRLGAGGRGRRRDRRQEPQEVRARARRLRPLRHPGHRRRGRGRRPGLGDPDQQHRPGLQLQQADDRDGRRVRRLRRSAHRPREGPASR